MVILCVIPATSDFGNAEVVKLARKYDPDGIRTLGVVTKCDDAANAEASDIVEKVLMERNSDVRLQLGFHCVVNRSQKNIEAGMSREDLWDKEKKVFTTSDLLKRIPKHLWGTPRLMEKIAKVQESRVDECLPKIKSEVRHTLLELEQKLRELPIQPESEVEQFRLFNDTISKIREDLSRRIRGEFMSAESADRNLTIAPKVASMVQEFRQDLLSKNPEWLGEDMIDEVDDTVKTFVTGHTVDNLTGPQVFINFIKQVFIKEGLLEKSVNGLVADVGEHLRMVVQHVIQEHANMSGALCNRLEAKAEDHIDQLTAKARYFCKAISECQEVTFTTDGEYTENLNEFRKSIWLNNDPKKYLAANFGAEGQLPSEFLELLKQAKEEPRKLATLEICASLHVYTKQMIKNFVETSAKLVKFNMLDKLAKKLEESWREDQMSSLRELFPKDDAILKRQQDLKEKIETLYEFKEQLSSLRTTILLDRRAVTGRTFSEKAEARAG
ncbi:unnamed protein product [Durusdinium trenchii]|uniref:Uncharacterized protein n=2 Tax=Durusdinium trenchii TaxID=1381693 RepID=A0ABP0I8I2_9DINO